MGPRFGSRDSDRVWRLGRDPHSEQGHSNLCKAKLFRNRALKLFKSGLKLPIFISSLIAAFFWLWQDYLLQQTKWVGHMMQRAQLVTKLLTDYFSLQLAAVLLMLGRQFAFIIRQVLHTTGIHSSEELLFVFILSGKSWVGSLFSMLYNHFRGGGRFATGHLPLCIIKIQTNANSTISSQEVSHPSSVLT